MRALLAGVLLLAGALLVPAATTAWWLRTDVVSTSGYVDTVTPLATDPAVTRVVEDVLFDATMRAVNASDLVNRVDQALADRAVPADSLLDLHHLTGPTQSRVRVLVRRAVHAVVASPRFVTVWRSVNRGTHEQVVAALRGDSSALRRGPDATVDLRLDALSGTLKQAMAEAGIPFASSLPRLSATYPVGTVRDLHRARVAYAALDAGAVALPLLTLVLLGLGLLVARRRARALAWTALIALLSLGALVGALLVARGWYAGVVPTAISRPAAHAVFDALTAGLRHDMLRVALAAAVLLGLAVLLPRGRSGDQQLVG